MDPSDDPTKVGAVLSPGKWMGTTGRKQEQLVGQQDFPDPYDSHMLCVRRTADGILYQDKLPHGIRHTLRAHLIIAGSQHFPATHWKDRPIHVQDNHPSPRLQTDMEKGRRKWQRLRQVSQPPVRPFDHLFHRMTAGFRPFVLEYPSIHLCLHRTIGSIIPARIPIVMESEMNH